MQITLNQEEIHAAVEQYVRGQINISANQELSIDFTAGRGANGISATLDIRPAAVTAPSKPVVRAVETPAEDPVVEEAEPEVEAADPAEESAPEADTVEETSAEEETKPARSGKSIFSKAS